LEEKKIIVHTWYLVLIHFLTSGIRAERCAKSECSPFVLPWSFFPFLSWIGKFFLFFYSLNFLNLKFYFQHYLTPLILFWEKNCFPLYLFFLFNLPFNFLTFLHLKKEKYNLISLLSKFIWALNRKKTFIFIINRKWA